MGIFRKRRPLTPEEEEAKRLWAVWGSLHQSLRTEIIQNVSYHGAAEWIEHVLPLRAEEYSVAWLNANPDPTADDLNKLWSKTLNNFWDPGMYPWEFSDETKEMGAQTGKAVMDEVLRRLGVEPTP